MKKHSSRLLISLSHLVLAASGSFAQWPIGPNGFPHYARYYYGPLNLQLITVGTTQAHFPQQDTLKLLAYGSDTNIETFPVRRTGEQRAPDSSFHRFNFTVNDQAGNLIYNWELQAQLLPFAWSDTMWFLDYQTSIRELLLVGLAPGAYTLTARSKALQLSGLSVSLTFYVDPVTSISPEPGRLEFQLEQNFPNPFNPKTSIQYHVPERGEVSLAVYNALGQQAAVLASGLHEAGGYRAEWSAVGYSTGTYFYRLVTKQGTYVKTMSLIK